MDRERFEDWISRYERAWRTAGTASLGELFTDDASYSTAPFERPYVGLEAISRLWEAEREGPEELFEIESRVVAVEGATGVARIEVRYGDPVDREYRDLWVIILDADGRCRSFEEWPFWPPGSAGTYLPGPSDQDAKGGDDA
ncbi:MAG: YybH family protein [Solirubrobacterales bacterium]